jgi:hypothetical protein
MFSHICCKCILCFQTYVAFKCFMLHVFPALRRVRGAGEWGAASRWSANVACDTLGGRRLGHSGARVCLRELGEHMEMEGGCACTGGANE